MRGSPFNNVIGFATGVDKIVLDDDVFTRFTGTAEGMSISASNYRVGAAVSLRAFTWLSPDAGRFSPIPSLKAPACASPEPMPTKGRA